jgi:hypothetical protein
MRGFVFRSGWQKAATSGQEFQNPIQAMKWMEMMHILPYDQEQTADAKLRMGRGPGIGGCWVSF